MKCCKPNGVADECLEMCDTNDLMFSHCNQLCVYLYEHIAKACIHNPGKYAMYSPGRKCVLIS